MKFYRQRALGFSAFAKPTPSATPVFSAFAVYNPATSAPAPASVPAPAIVTAPVATPQAQVIQQVPPTAPASAPATAQSFIVASSGGSSGGGASASSQPFMNVNVDSGEPALELPPDQTDTSSSTLANGWGIGSWISNLSNTDWLWIIAAAAGVYFLAED
ncbi:MAG: hypothetical protein ACRD33_00065 [Candidatus Acidiferrales bacterium]